ncbi:MAG TPA: helix-turn-helix domain-containing protein [Actinomycetes bacterium]|jgi:sugar-specific transcriptional regulator TrmB|nr:helix-turn-helix domain-containing protein [Actinomycetes bacterium]
MVGDETRWRDEDQLIAGLAEFGLGRNEARLYLAAVGRSSMRAAELAQLADISRTKAYDALRVLVSKGLFTEEPGRVARFRAADARTVANFLRQQTFTEKASLVEGTSRLVADLFDRYYATAAADDPFDFVQLLQHGEAAWARQEAMIAGARREVVRTRQRGPSGILRTDDLSLRAGVSYRSIFEREVLADPRLRAWLAERQAGGERIRFVDRVTTGFCVVDRTAIMLSLNPRVSPWGAGVGNWLALEHPGLGALLTDIFERHWAAAATVSAPDQAG